MMVATVVDSWEELTRVIDERNFECLNIFFTKTSSIIPPVPFPLSFRWFSVLRTFHRLFFRYSTMCLLLIPRGEKIWGHCVFLLVINRFHSWCRPLYWRAANAILVRFRHRNTLLSDQMWFFAFGTAIRRTYHKSGCYGTSTFGFNSGAYYCRKHVGFLLFSSL